METKAKVLFHSSIRISGEKTVYFDPFKIEGEPHDADIIFVTHSHYDHFSAEDIKKIKTSDTLLVVPKSMEKSAKGVCPRVKAVSAGEHFDADGIAAEAVAAYNVGKLFHTKLSGWLGYIVTIDGERYYIAGDTDRNKDIENVKCDIALVPIGGKFTMNAKEAAGFVNHIKPKIAIPTHYGSVAGSYSDADVFAGYVDKDITVDIQLRG
ncbi:MAG: MBL fold metallo-hydrolase [Oscillospiraceae bacterium]|nr:MBL fold metallo-hydrolase [Oscillospiraceae bacterium]